MGHTTRARRYNLFHLPRPVMDSNKTWTSCLTLVADYMSHFNCPMVDNCIDSRCSRLVATKCPLAAQAHDSTHTDFVLTSSSNCCAWSGVKALMWVLSSIQHSQIACSGTLSIFRPSSIACQLLVSENVSNSFLEIQDKHLFSDNVF